MMTYVVSTRRGMYVGMGLARAGILPDTSSFSGRSYLTASLASHTRELVPRGDTYRGCLKRKREHWEEIPGVTVYEQMQYGRGGSEQPRSGVPYSTGSCRLFS